MKVTRKGTEVELSGIQPIVGDSAPDFTLANIKEEVVRLVELTGEPILISVVPDIDTRICSLQTKRFNQEAATVKGIQFLTISNNTKEEQENWCAAEGVDMEMLHDTENVFGEAYGLFIPEMNRLARAVFVIDRAGKIAYEQISAEIAEEPDYNTALEKAKALV